MELGAASIKIELSDGVIKVVHGTDNVVLQEWKATPGDWEEIWKILTALKARAAK